MPIVFRLSLTASLLLACAPVERDPVRRAPLPTPELEPTAPHSTSAPSPSVPCDHGDTKTCVVDLPTHGSVQHCAQGEQICEDGVWGPCEVTYSDPV